MSRRIYPRRNRGCIAAIFGWTVGGVGFLVSNRPLEHVSPASRGHCAAAEPPRTCPARVKRAARALSKLPRDFPRNRADLVLPGTSTDVYIRSSRSTFPASLSRTPCRRFNAAYAPRGRCATKGNQRQIGGNVSFRGTRRSKELLGSLRR